jgi:hypothetical protein
VVAGVAALWIFATHYTTNNGDAHSSPPPSLSGYLRTLTPPPPFPLSPQQETPLPEMSSVQATPVRLPTATTTTPSVYMSCIYIMRVCARARERT